MKKYFLKISLEIVKKYNPNITNNNLETIRYGLEGIYLTFTKFIILILLSFMFGILKEVIILSLFYNGIRTVAFGLHAKKSYQCLIMSLVMFIGGAYFCIYISFNIYIKLFISIICILVLFRFAPADTEKRPIISKKRRITYKVLSTLFGILYTSLIIIFNSSMWSMFLLLGMIEACLMIHPLIYKIFDLPYDNYKNFNYGLSN